MLARFKDDDRPIVCEMSAEEARLLAALLHKVSHEGMIVKGMYPSCRTLSGQVGTHGPSSSPERQLRRQGKQMTNYDDL